LAPCDATPVAALTVPSARSARSVRIGCSGWNYKHWRASFYEPGLPVSRWLERYAQSFDTVEVNTTFYRLPRRDAVAHWVEQTPPGFCFAVKASRYLTHIRRLADIGAGIATFYERIQPLIDASRLGPVLWQLPENFHRDDERLAGALAELPPGRHAFEFRDASWFVPEVYALLRAHDVALVIGDHPERPFQTLVATAPWRYIRFHYGSRGRRGNYSPAELAGWASRIRRWRRDGPVFAYFNNDWEGFAPRDALELAELVEHPGARASARPRRASRQARAGRGGQRRS
jgi:uncharacterized protein YecE (DUF72 family)